MRLEKIKLAGFKSFVDPTTIPLPGNLVGVVGPNGCGKSNVIDAVRWVMGESSAKHLRGDTMADVIFNGSSTRKPVGVASVELVFDNSHGTAGGEYAAYQKIAIKRLVGRDGQSTYMLNGTRCRRKDITDLFLGTGLGARSYAIIEQGTISRLIEAKPDELREIIEEAAGISRYKERRHETETRMRHTRENLERLEDLRGELKKQVDSLQRQVKKAERYLALREQERAARGALLRVRWARAQDAQSRRKSELDRFADELRRCASTSREIQASLAECQNLRDTHQSSLQEIQAHFYEVGAEIGRLDDYLTQATRSREESRRDLERLERERGRAEQELEHDREQLERIRAELLEGEHEMVRVLEREQIAAAARRAADADLQAVRQALEVSQADLLRSRGELELLRSRERQIEDQQRGLELRRQRLAAEREELLQSLKDRERVVLQQSIEQAEQRSEELRLQVESLTEAVEQSQLRLRANRQQLHDVRAELHGAQGRLTSLELLQRHAMGKDKAELTHWLQQKGLDRVPRLAESLEVAQGWESAVEHVLGLHLEALCVEDASPYVGDLAEASFRDSVVLFERRPERPDRPGTDLPCLMDQVQSVWNLSALLGGVYCAPDLAAARAACVRLREHESVVTINGERVGPGWIALRQRDDGKAGVLQRERELREVRHDLQELSQRDARLVEESAEIERRIAAAESERKQLELEIRGIEREILEWRNQLHVIDGRQQQSGKRLEQVEAELEELRMQSADAAELRHETVEAWRSNEGRVALQEAQSEAIRVRLAQLQDQWDAAEQRFEVAQEELRAIRSRCETLRSSEQLTERHLDRAGAHCAEATSRLESLSARCRDEQPLDGERSRLEALRGERQQVEIRLAESRRQLTELDARMRQLGESRLANEREIEGWKEKIEQTRIEFEGDQVRLETLQEQFGEWGLTPAAPDDGNAGESNERQWQQEINRVSEDLARLGAVNLMAVEEHAEQKARLDELEQQYRDLAESLETLLQAIEKIDRECRSLFKNTFDRIDAGFQSMFPKLFGGGNASLELTERDLLDAGVTVVARPPGKRNSSIHLLSGGEKALTAVALVFAIFELNPAPFCLLDEVDAPLDDANVGRFCGLVKEMSERVQFLFITHNKVTMEIAQYLAGVTMKEPGVSRIVAVDVAAAVELVAV